MDKLVGIYVTSLKYAQSHYEVKMIDGPFHYISLREIAMLVYDKLHPAFDYLVIEVVYEFEGNQELVLTYGWFQLNYDRNMLVESRKPEALSEKGNFFARHATKIYINGDDGDDGDVE